TRRAGRACCLAPSLNTSRWRGADSASRAAPLDWSGWMRLARSSSLSAATASESWEQRASSPGSRARASFTPRAALTSARAVAWGGGGERGGSGGVRADRPPIEQPAGAFATARWGCDCDCPSSSRLALLVAQPREEMLRELARELLSDVDALVARSCTGARCS